MIIQIFPVSVKKNKFKNKVKAEAFDALNSGLIP